VNRVDEDAADFARHRDQDKAGQRTEDQSARSHHIPQWVCAAAPPYGRGDAP